MVGVILFNVTTDSVTVAAANTPSNLAGGASGLRFGNVTAGATPSWRQNEAPWMSTGGLYWIPEKPFYHFESLLLPLSDDDEIVNMILGMTIVF